MTELYVYSQGDLIEHLVTEWTLEVANKVAEYLRGGNAVSSVPLVAVSEDKASGSYRHLCK
jgi:hypothetical protein